MEETDKDRIYGKWCVCLCMCADMGGNESM